LNHPIRNFPRLAAVLSLVCFAAAPFAFAQVKQPPRPGAMLQPAPPQQQPPAQTPAPRQPMKKASELISRQAPISIDRGLYDSLSPTDSRVLVNLTTQRAYLLAGDQVAIDTPISSGKRAGMTPTGSFTITEKDKDHRSNIYGDFKDKNGRTVRAGVSVRIDSAPSGTRFVGAPMLWFMRLTSDGVGMHVGILPGYPASHGCIRMPPQAAEMFFHRVKLGTPVRIVRD
jgi:lipoprotein-anchoring transpeptidase ErfK/SrfK